MTKSGDLAQVIAGNVLELSKFRSNLEIATAASMISKGDLTLTKGSVLNALNFLRRGTSVDLVRLWASFVKRGYIKWQSQSERIQGVVPISITYDKSHEEAIVQVINRLDELGDIVDGEISDDELLELIGAMSDPGN